MSDLMPNIKFIGRDLIDRKTRKVLRRVNPIESFMHVREKIELPNAELQKDKRKFYHENAAEIRRLFPHLYKLIISKGGKNK